MRHTPHRLAFAPTALYGGVELRTASLWVGPSAMTGAHSFLQPEIAPRADPTREDIFYSTPTGASTVVVFQGLSLIHI